MKKPDMCGYLLKAAARPAVVETEWRRGHLAPGERVAAITGWSVHAPGGGVPGLKVVAARLDAERTRLVLEGGAPGLVYMLVVRVATDTRRALCRAVVVRIALEEPPDRGVPDDPD
jgi:hypothetical protein